MLLEHVKTRETKDIDLKKICATIKKISESSKPEEVTEHYREIDALVIHHATLMNGSVPDEPPFSGRFMPGSMGILCNMLNFPPLLQQIIAQYIEEMSQ